jgi:hypothetical protein
LGSIEADLGESENERARETLADVFSDDVLAARLDAHRLQLRAVEILAAASKLLEHDLTRNVHLARVYVKDLHARVLRGVGQLDLRSSRQDRSSAGSSTSGLFVAVMTSIMSLELNPSSWLKSSSIVRCTSLSPD